MTITTQLRQAKGECTLLTVKDAAELTGLTEWWVRQLIAKGEIRAMNVGSYGKSARWRIDPEDLSAWLVSRENRPRDLMAA
ncbi:helix-turn-helix domain-containing protein [Mycetocola miduiensis]|uniref:DNA binding domain-containing protein, excisionase family n=1 Tax=Mycetocola miduiensis TaxID=995034 RepID=A0A1I4YZX0_9MICO|nr:helix-turn-helix domain-containing protein [Mycetocola miduiensis]SFN43333.1 DNA binding domain-containing protein, excisionase family [Mycetocola miduiensis]